MWDDIGVILEKAGALDQYKTTRDSCKISLQLSLCSFHDISCTAGGLCDTKTHAFIQTDGIGIFCKYIQKNRRLRLCDARLKHLCADTASAVFRQDIKIIQFRLSLCGMETVIADGDAICDDAGVFRKILLNLPADSRKNLVVLYFPYIFISVNQLPAETENYIRVLCGYAAV